MSDNNVHVGMAPELWIKHLICADVSKNIYKGKHSFIRVGGVGMV